MLGIGSSRFFARSMISARRLCRTGRRLCWAPAGRPHAGRISTSEIITLLLVFHSSGFKHLKSFHHGFAEPLLRGYFPGMPRYEHLRRPAEKCLRAAGVLPRQPPGDQDRSLLHQLHRLAGLRTPIASTGTRSSPVWPSVGKTSMGWFFGFKLQLVFNNCHEIVALTRRAAKQN